VQVGMKKMAFSTNISL